MTGTAPTAALIMTRLTHEGTASAFRSPKPSNTNPAIKKGVAMMTHKKPGGMGTQ